MAASNVRGLEGDVVVPPEEDVSKVIQVKT